LGSRLELRLGDPSDSQISRKAAMSTPTGAPGRGVTPDERHFLTFAPQVATGTTDDLVKAIAAAWTGAVAPAVRQLPALVPFAQLPTITPDGSPTLILPIGIAEADLAPVCLDFAEDPHLLIFGESRSGKSSVLRAVTAAIIAGNTPEQARIVVLDYRRSMLGDLEGDHLIGYATTAGQASALLSSVAEYMQRRVPGPDVTPQELRTGSWRAGPECFVLVDDYDLVTGGGANPLSPLLEFLPQARDIGLHLIIARRSGGAARALFEPVIARLRELATPGLILSGDVEEGALIGSVRPRQLPPGRATLVTRRDGARLIQLGYLAPDTSETPSPPEPPEGEDPA
jgi:S-DNA-T family DNA segregation ATPase FtsK/SpoIIIE